MNPWDVFTWFCSVALAGSGIAIFAFFLRDVGGILNRDFQHSEDEEEPPSKESNSWDQP